MANKFEVKLNKLANPKGATKAFANVTLYGEFVITGISVVEGKNGAFVQMPQKQYEKDGAKKFADTFFPVTKEAREELSDAVLAAFAAED